MDVPGLHSWPVIGSRSQIIEAQTVMAEAEPDEKTGGGDEREAKLRDGVLGG